MIRRTALIALENKFHFKTEFSFCPVLSSEACIYWGFNAVNKYLLRRGKAQDLDLGIAVLSALELESLPAPMKGVVARLAVQGTLRKGDPASAAAYLERASGELEATVRDSLRGYIAHTEGDRSK